MQKVHQGHVDLSWLVCWAGLFFSLKALRYIDHSHHLESKQPVYLILGIIFDSPKTMSVSMSSMAGEYQSHKQCHIIHNFKIHLLCRPCHSKIVKYIVHPFPFKKPCSCDHDIKCSQWPFSEIPADSFLYKFTFLMCLLKPNLLSNGQTSEKQK